MTANLGRMRVLVAMVAAVSLVAIAAVALLQKQEHDARAKETRARVYATSLRQSISDLVPVGDALSERWPEVFAPLIRGALNRSAAQLEPIRSIDPSRTAELDAISARIRRIGVARTPAVERIAIGEVTRASKIADEIAERQHDVAERAELRSIIGSGGALAFALLAVILLVFRDRRRLLADAEAHTAVVRQLADRDSLTDLPNRRRFDADLDLLTVDAGQVEIAVLDLNGFKAINDRLGHDAGDAVLIKVSRDLQSCVGDAGTVYRTGGDEFCVMSRPGVRIADLARSALERDGSATVGSVGAASFPTDHELPREVVRLADRRMYDAKRAIAQGVAVDPGGRRASPARRASDVRD